MARALVLPVTKGLAACATAPQVTTARTTLGLLHLVVLPGHGTPSLDFLEGRSQHNPHEADNV